MFDPPRRVLHVAHNHPAFHAGGTEIFAKALSDHFNRHGLLRSHFVGAALPRYQTPHPGSNLVGSERTGADFVLAGGQFDPVLLSQADAFGLLKAFRDLLVQVKPDVIHVHHVLMVGLEAIVIARKARPDSRLVMTLHDFYPLCHHDGLMMAPDGALCSRPSAETCARCFPEVGALPFRLRDLAVRRAFEAIDCFVAPSRFLRDRYVDWGLPAEKIRLIRNGLSLPDDPPGAAAPRAQSAPTHTRFGFFGHINRAKGILVLLDAVRRLRDRGQNNFSLHIHGADTFAPEAVRGAFHRDLQDLAPHVTWHGAYDRRHVLALMQGVDWVMVPSVWWENDPLVIQEAFLARRPVLCSDIGGMAEAVPDGQAGHHVAVGDAAAWAEAMDRCRRADPSDVPDAFPPPRTMSVCARQYLEVYGP